MPGQMVLRIWDVEHGACAMLTHHHDGRDGRLARIDSGSTVGWRPSSCSLYILWLFRHNVCWILIAE